MWWSAAAILSFHAVAVLAWLFRLPLVWDLRLQTEYVWQQRRARAILLILWVLNQSIARLSELLDRYCLRCANLEPNLIDMLPWCQNQLFQCQASCLRNAFILANMQSMLDTQRIMQQGVQSGQ